MVVAKQVRVLVHDCWKSASQLYYAWHVLEVALHS